MDKNVIKAAFGGVIFLFGSALGYFTASYLMRVQSFDYYNTLLLFGGAYILIGIVVAQIFPVSLGFLFAADVFILHVLSHEYRGYQDIYKIAITGIMLVVLYAFAWWKLRDVPAASAMPPPPQPPGRT